MTKSAPLRLGFGCSGAWGQAWFSRAKAMRILRFGHDGGLRRYDTAPFYADGEAERRLGAFLAETDADDIIVSTKTGTRFEGGRPVKDFSEAAIRRDVEGSIARLGRRRIDIFYLHGPDERAIEAAAPVLETLKTEGQIASAGVCGEGPSLERALQDGVYGSLMARYNVLDRRHAPLFRQARARGVETVAIAPLAQGLYRRGFFLPTGPGDFWRIARALAKQRAALAEARSGALEFLHEVEGWSAAQLCLAFVLESPEVDFALTTTTRLQHLGESLAAACAHGAPPAILERMLALDGAGAGA